MRLDGYMTGCNLGHWISQYGRKGAEHWDTYITEPDFARMADWGVDHIRLPVDYFIPRNIHHLLNAQFYRHPLLQFHILN